VSDNDTNKTKKKMKKKNVLALFDVDGTLTAPRGEITDEMMQFLLDLNDRVHVGIVGGSDLPKQEEQLGRGVATKFPWNFSQNGLVAYRHGHLLEVQTIAKHLGEDNVKRIVNWTLSYLSKLDLPVKRGTFVEFRSGMFNVSPIGRNCSREERDEYEKYDLANNVRSDMVEAMRKEFADLDLSKYSAGRGGCWARPGSPVSRAVVLGRRIRLEKNSLTRYFVTNVFSRFFAINFSSTLQKTKKQQLSASEDRFRSTCSLEGGIRRTASGSLRRRGTTKFTFSGTRPSRAETITRYSLIPTRSDTP